MINQCIWGTLFSDKPAVFGGDSMGFQPKISTMEIHNKGGMQNQKISGGASDQPRSGFVGVQTGAFLGIPWDSNQEM